MKTKFSKKLISLLLSVLMVVSALPMSAITASAATDEVINIGLTGSYVGITAADSNRYSASGQTATLNIVNDQEDSNFSIGYVNIDISAYKGREFKTFPLTFGKGADADGDSQGLKFWYTGNTNGDGLTTNGRVANNGNVTGTTNGHLGKAITYYALTEIASFTKAQFNAGTMNIDVAAAANATLARGGTRLVIMVTQAQSGGKGSTGGWTDTKITFNKSQACSATLKGQTTQTGKLSNNGTGLTISGTESRWSNNQMNIVNDQQANNTDAGIIRYDISKIKGMTVESAKLNYKVDSWSADTVTTGLTFYYSTSISNTSYINNGETKSTGWTCGSGTTANNSFATGLGFSTSNTLGVVSKGSATSNTQMDIKSALQKAADANATYLYVIIMQSTAGGSGSTNGWSDTKISPANFTIDYSAKEKTRTRTEVASVKSNLTSKNFNNYPYSGTMTSTQDGSYSKSTLTGGDEMLNVLYSYGVSAGSSNYKDWGDSDYGAMGVQYGDITLLWDGVNKMACPINYFHKRTTSWTGSGAGYPQSVYMRGNGYADNSVVYLNHAWHGADTSGGYKTKTDNTINYVNSRIEFNPVKGASGDNYYYSNTLYVDGSKLDFNGAKRTTVNLYLATYYIGNGSNKYRDFTDFGNNSIRVINYAPIADAIRKGKEIYNTVSNDENSYCPTDLYNFYEALNALMNFNPNNYFAYNNNGYATCCDAMAALDDYISPAQSPLKKSNTTYTHSYTNGEVKNAQKHAIHCNDCGEDIEEACSFTLTSTVDSTCTTTGTKTYTCSKCSGTVTETIPMKEHNWGAWNGDYSSTKHTRQCQDCKKWDEYYLCELVDIEGKDVTCTEDGLTVGKVCSVCNKIRTAQETISALGHSYTGSINSDGKAVYTCEKGDDSYTVELGAYNAIVETANEAITNAYLYESVADVETALNENQFDISKVETQDSLDEKTNAITTAVNALVLKTFTVTFKTMVNGNETTVSSEKVLLGATVQLKVPDDVQGDVYKWIYSTGDSDVKYNSNERTISHVVGHDVTIIAYVGQDADITNTYKVTVKGRNNQVTDVQYLAQNLNLGDASLNIQSIVFYSVTGYIVNGQTVGTLAEVTLTQDTIIEPIYSAVGKEFDITPLSDDIKINGRAGVYSSYWDQKVTVTAPSATDATAWYIDGQIVGYGSSFTFRCAKACTVSYSNGVDLDATAALNFLDYGNYRNHTITVVGGYSVPENATDVKVGVYLKTVKNPADTTAKIDKETIITNNTTGKKYVTKFTDTNQFVFTTTRSANTPILIGAVVFVEYTVDGVAKTAYSDATTIYGIN